MSAHRVASAAAALALALVPLAAVAVPAQADEAGFSYERVVSRTVTAADGTTRTENKQVTVTADVTTELRSRQVVTVSWSGARPSSNIEANVTGDSAWQHTEYPVVVLQCRGDDSAAEIDARISPETCWTTAPGVLGTRTFGGLAANALYRLDAEAEEADKVASVPSAESWEATCPEGTASVAGSEDWSKYVLPFVGVDGTEYWNCGSDELGSLVGLASEMGYDTPLGANDKVEVTRLDGTGTTNFEVRTAAENGTLGCSATVPCAIVVIPIMGITCQDASTVCNQEGLQDPGSTYSDQLASASAVTAQWWWSASNWNNRVTIPIEIAPTDTTCQTSTSSSTLQLYGSALISGAAEQWRPAYCTDPDRFLLRINDQVEGTAYDNLRDGYASGVVSTYPEEDPPDGASTLAYAPVAVTGFAIAFVIDDPVTGKQATSLNLNPRLLAKLMTGSYAGTASVKNARSDLADNPGSLQLDPEFQQLNPELSTAPASSIWWQIKLSFSTLYSVSDKADLMEALTSYIAADTEAMAFLAGAADPWGMTVNESYQGIELPRRSWPLEDEWVLEASAGTCDAKQPVAWFTKLMAPVSDVHKVADDLLMAKPESITNTVYYNDSTVCKSSRSTLPIGSRTMLGLVTLSDAARYKLPTASLRTTGTGTDATFVAPTTSSLLAAVSAMTSSAAGEPYLPDATALHESTTAYPGTMVLHAAFPLSGLTATAAADAASFVQIATTEGQVEGQGTGELPEGYAPLTSSGATAELFAAAQDVATAVAAQSGSMTVASTASGTASASTSSETAETSESASSGSAVSSQVLAAPEATAVPGLAAPTAAATAAAATTPTPDAAVSGPLRAALPAGLAAAALAGAAVPFVRRTPRERP